jgi:23S rRNA (guanine2445-N2)-methyltransferase / 23S rRNA (guanine2069-N7)-methyltransferase
LVNTLRFLATCPKGLGNLLVDELRTLGAESLRETPAGVSFEGPLSVAYRACLWSRLANRVLLQLAEFAVGSDQDLYEGVAAQPWQEHMRSGSTLAVDFSGRTDFIRNSQFGAQRVKDGVVDAMRAQGLSRPSVDLKRPDLRLNARLNRGRLILSIDLSGESLHRRGYRLDPGKAPLKENLAAAVVLRSGWADKLDQGWSIIDPMCGSGTLLIEAALIGLDRAPGLARQRFGFEGWLQHNPQQWRALVADAETRRRDTLPEGVEIRGYDGDIAAIRRAEENAARLGLEKVVRFRTRSIGELQRPSHMPMEQGVLVCNPPWGERIGRRESLPLLYRQLGELFAREFRGWQAAVLTNDSQLGRAIGLRSHRQYRLHSGPIDLSLLLFDLAPDNRLAETGPQPVTDTAHDTKADDFQPAPLGDGAVMVLNRLRKNQKRLKPWLRREAVSCYRLYDADIPEYAAAIDVYQGTPHIAEYAPPKAIDEATAERRMDDVIAAVRAYFELATSTPLACKRRQRQRGSQQYERQARRGERITVEEGPVKVLVNLHDYLDTGLFLDHRPLRLRLGAEAAGKHFLNLFCYTGVATLHAAVGGAATSTSVDLSNTYLDWLRDNLALNGLSERQHRIERADVRAWLAKSDRQWDLILLDPPSFSNSKSTEESFDVQRDHVNLLELTMARLAPQGVLYFSNNRKKFRLDESVSARWQVEDITPSTLGPDFQRGAPIHRCWRLQHRISG